MGFDHEKRVGSKLPEKPFLLQGTKKVKISILKSTILSKKKTTLNKGLCTLCSIPDEKTFQLSAGSHNQKFFELLMFSALWLSYCFTIQLEFNECAAKICKTQSKTDKFLTRHTSNPSLIMQPKLLPSAKFKFKQIQLQIEFPLPGSIPLGSQKLYDNQ